MHLNHIVICKTFPRISPLPTFPTLSWVSLVVPSIDEAVDFWRRWITYWASYFKHTLCIILSKHTLREEVRALCSSDVHFLKLLASYLEKHKQLCMHCVFSSLEPIRKSSQHTNQEISYFQERGVFQGYHCYRHFPSKSLGAMEPTGQLERNGVWAGKGHQHHLPKRRGRGRKGVSQDRERGELQALQRWHQQPETMDLNAGTPWVSF